MDRLPTPIFLGFPCGSAGNESACNVGVLGSIPGLGRSSGDPLEKGKATHSSILAWRIPWTSPWGRKELEMTQRLSLSIFTVSRRRVEALTPTDLRTKMYYHASSFSSEAC